MRAQWLALGLLALGCGASSVAPPSPLSEQSDRHVLLPLRLGWLSSERSSGVLSSTVSLGGRASGRVLLYFEFEAPSPARPLLRAALLLGLPPNPAAPIEVELARSEPAHAELASWSDQPRAVYPRLTAQLSAGGDRVARLDVTELVRAQSKPGEPLRIQLRAEPNADEPMLVETGAGAGQGPRLELYYQ
jgi:hypothetical protein